MTIPTRKFRRLIRRFGAGIVPAIILSGCVGATFDLHPDPAYDPRQVVAIQLEALNESHADMAGIEVAFRFASPANREITGPQSRFARMLRGPVYRVMLHHDRVEYAPLVREGAVAVQRVVLYDGPDRAIFDFYLRRQTIEPYEQCWMTEAVLRVEPTRPPQPTPVPAPPSLNV